LKTDAHLISILRELSRDAEEVDGGEVEDLVGAIKDAPRVFVAGAGRSGFAARAFANRLAHTGIPTYFVGEPTTPPITKGDLLVVGSGSGQTASLVSMVTKAHSMGARVGTLTIHPENEIGRIADYVVKIPGVTAKTGDETKSRPPSIQMTGSSFEQLSWLIYDSIIISVRDATKQSNEDLFARHANLE